MALICPNCKARNRSIAKFCIECITSLPTGCPDTDFAPTVRATPKTAYLDLALASKTRKSKATDNPQAEVRQDTALASKGLWISLAGLMVALLFGSAGWLVAGAGGWYLYTAGSAQVDPPRSATLPAAVASPSSEALPITQVADAAVPVAASLAVPLPDPRGAQGQGVTTSRETATKVGREAAVLPTAAIAATRPAAAAASLNATLPGRAEAPKARLAASLEPRAACSTMNFISAAQCMVAQCTKPEFRLHAQCEAVRRQQRLEEEKRNPVAP